MEDGSAIILSVAKYYTPQGKSIQDNGVTPDELVGESEPVIGDSDDDNTLEPDPAAKKPAEDVILKKAIEVIQNKTA